MESAILEMAQILTALAFGERARKSSPSLSGAAWKIDAERQHRTTLKVNANCDRDADHLLRAQQDVHAAFDGPHAPRRVDNSLARLSNSRP